MLIRKLLLISLFASAPVLADSATPAQGASAEPEVVLYGAQWCRYCTYARRYFEQKDIDFVEYDIETSERGRRDYDAMDGRGIPIILVDGHRINGFKPGRFYKIYQAALEGR